MEKIKNFGTRPLWFWNALPTEKSITEVMENCAKKDGFAGFGILPYDACTLEYMGEEYLRLYGVVLREAKRLGLKICLYDEWWFPSGSAGGILKKKYPEACAKRLDMEEYYSDDKMFSVALPADGKIMATVAMKDGVIIDLAKFAGNGILEWVAPETGFTVLCFILRDAGWDRVDYLSPDAVKKFIACTHDVYYRHFSEYFGNVIDSSFYDEPQFYAAEGRMWTEAYNDRFKEKYGEDPAVYYPALFYDIGEKTAAARNKLLSVRADLYAEGFPGTIQKWCTAHGISLTGHVDQEEVENPCGMTGDLIKSFKYQDIPGVDEVFKEGRASAVYKVVSSSAVNYGKQLVMCECFGAMNTLPTEAVYRESYDLYTKGVNFLVPHAVWMSADEKDVMVKPELSYRDPYYGKILPDFNVFCSAVAEKLQAGGQVNSVAMLYPIENMQYMYTMNWEGHPYYGGPTCEKNNYLRLGQFLSREINCDYNFLHPEVLAEKCALKDGKLVLESPLHFQKYGAVILPGMKAASLKTLQILKQFVLDGGTLIAVSELPAVAAEIGASDEVRALCRELFGLEQIGMHLRETAHGKGRCFALPFGERKKIKDILGGVALDTRVLNCADGLQYIHKRAEKDVWFFAEILQDAETAVELEGNFRLTYINPRTLARGDMPSVFSDGITRFNLKLNKEECLIVEGERV